MISYWLLGETLENTQGKSWTAANFEVKHSPSMRRLIMPMMLISKSRMRIEPKIFLTLSVACEHKSEHIVINEIKTTYLVADCSLFRSTKLLKWAKHMLRILGSPGILKLRR